MNRNTYSLGLVIQDHPLIVEVALQHYTDMEAPYAVWKGTGISIHTDIAPAWATVGIEGIHNEFRKIPGAAWLGTEVSKHTSPTGICSASAGASH